MGKSMKYHPATDLQMWRLWAPSALDNQLARSLLGRHIQRCRWEGAYIHTHSVDSDHGRHGKIHTFTSFILYRPFGSLGDEELQAASLALASIDNVLLLGQVKGVLLHAPVLPLP